MFFLQLKQLIDQYLSEIQSQYTLYSWLDYWFDTFKVGFVSKSTMSSVERTIRLHIKAHIADKPLSDVTVQDLQLGVMKNETSRMRCHARAILFESFKKAVDLKLLSENIVEYVSVPTHHYKEGTALTVEQEKRFFVAAKVSQYYGSYLFMRWTGCRSAEAFLVKWSDVDFDQAVVWIPGTKTEGSARLVPLFPVLFDYLSALDRSGEYVFSGTSDGAKHAIRRIDLDFHVNCKDFRTTFATRCCEDGVSQNVLQKWLGHTTTRTTNKYYVKVLPDFERSEIAKVKKIIYK